MKEDLIKLIEGTEQIKTKFHSTGGQGMPVHNIIYNNEDFALWKQEVQLELQEIYDRTGDQFIRDILVLTKQGFNGWKDEASFNEFSNPLKSGGEEKMGCFGNAVFLGSVSFREYSTQRKEVLD